MRGAAGRVDGVLWATAAATLVDFTDFCTGLRGDGGLFETVNAGRRPRRRALPLSHGDGHVDRFKPRRGHVGGSVDGRASYKDPA